MYLKRVSDTFVDILHPVLETESKVVLSESRLALVPPGTVLGARSRSEGTMPTRAALLLPPVHRGASKQSKYERLQEKCKSSLEYVLGLRMTDSKGHQTQLVPSLAVSAQWLMDRLGEAQWLHFSKLFTRNGNPTYAVSSCRLDPDIVMDGWCSEGHLADSQGLCV